MWKNIIELYSEVYPVNSKTIKILKLMMSWFCADRLQKKGLIVYLRLSKKTNYNPYM